MATNILLKEIETLQEDGYCVAVVEAEGVVNLLIENYLLPPTYNKPTTTLLLRIPEAYPNGNPDMFWTDADLLCENGQTPNTADVIETYLGKQWRRFSWHPQGWNPGTGNLCMYLEFVNSGFYKAAKR